MVRRLNPQARAASGLPRTLVALAIGLLHLMLVQQLNHRIGGDRAAGADMPPRLQVVYLHQLELSDPPAVFHAPLVRAAPETAFAAPFIAEPISLAVPVPVAGPAPAPMPRDLPDDAPPVHHAAAEASRHDSVGTVAADLLAQAALPVAPFDPVLPAPEAASARAVGARPSAEVARADSPAGTDEANREFQWPVSTRLSYRLDGNYRGEVNGSAEVEWINAAPRYQVNLDVTIGLPFAPLFTRRMRSDGRIVASGLQPQRYAEVSQLAWRNPQRATLSIDASGMRDTKGRHWPARHASGGFAVQDSASQFVQLSWLFTNQPELLTPGQLIELELALPRRLARWVYEVGQPRTVHTVFGAVEAVHVHPRAGTEQAGDLLAEAWFAPRLAYLPVQIRIEQSADVWLDLVLERRPQLAAD